MAMATSTLGGLAAAPFDLICGCPRSGTTLLATELMRRYDVAIPFETHFIPIFHRWAGLYGDLGQPTNRRRLLDDIYLFTRLWIRTSKTFDAAELVKASILVTEPYAEDIAARAEDYPTLMRSLFGEFAARNASARFADKSTFLAPVPPIRLERALGPIRILYLVRDGRDVFLSWKQTWFGAANAATAACLWRRHVDGIRQWSATPGAHVHIMRYEDLLKDPDGELAAAARFLDLAPRAVAVPAPLAAGMATAPEHARLRLAPDLSNAGKHVVGLPAAQRAVFERLAGDALSRHGYSVSGAPVAWPDLALEFLAVPFDRPDRGLGRAVKSALPLILNLGGRWPLGRWAAP